MLLDRCFLKQLIFEGKNIHRKIYNVPWKGISKYVPKGNFGTWTFMSALFRQTETKQPNLASSQAGPHLTCQIKFPGSVQQWSNRAQDQWKGFLALYFSHSPAPQHQASTGQGGESRFSWQRTEDEPRRNPLILWFGTDHGEYPWSLRIYQTMLPETICLFSLPYFHCYAGLMRWLEPFAPSSPPCCTHPAPAAPLGRSVMWAAIH